jgi:uncharacterized protein (DUF362 family)
MTAPNPSVLTRRCPYSRRHFLRTAGLAAAAAPWRARAADDEETEELPRATRTAPPPPAFSRTIQANAKVAVVRCRGFGEEVHGGLAKAFDLLGGIGGLVRGKTVTVKLNLTGTQFAQVFNRPVGDTYMTHPDSALALAKLLFQAGARRVRFVESNQRMEPLEQTIADGGWDVKAFESLGTVEWENTRNLGRYKQYAHFKVHSGGHLFSSFELNKAYDETDVLVSLCKLKNHLTCGVTLAMKNLFGITPNSLYGDQAPNERATAGRGPLHQRRDYRGNGLMPGELKTTLADSPFLRVPRIVADINEARPIHLSIIDGIVSMKGGEGPWAPNIGLITPGLLIVGLNPVSTDSVGTALMGYKDPRAIQGVVPFTYCDNHLLLAEQRGLGVLDLHAIEVVGTPIADAVCPFS